MDHSSGFLGKRHRLPMLALAVAAASALSATPARSQDHMRIISKDTGDGRNSRMDFQNYNTSTPAVDAGGTIRVPRGFGAQVFVYRHGIDVTPITYAVPSGGVVVGENMRVPAIQSNVFLPTPVPGGGDAVSRR